MSAKVNSRTRKSLVRVFLALQIVLLLITGALPLPGASLAPSAQVAAAATESKQVAQPTTEAPAKAPDTSTNTSSQAGPTTADAADAACDISFSDVANGSTYYDFVKCLTCKQVLGGFSDGTFRPNANITRGQLSKIVANAAGLNATPTGQTFEDVPTISPFYPFIERMAAKGYIGGYPCGGAGEPCGSGNKSYFRPNADATRGQISKIVSNAAGFNDAPVGQSFQDVAPGSSFYEWVQRLTSRSVMSGYACGGAGEPCGPGNKPYFRPHNKATRGQVAKIISNTFFPNCSNEFNSAQENIGKAFDSGKIDYGTFLLYRAYALFGDRRLPREYIGTGSGGEDSLLFHELNVAVEENNLPANMVAQLQPFIVRPADPLSVFNTPAYNPPAGQVAGGTKAPAAVDGGLPCTNGWASQVSNGTRYRVWARCSSPEEAVADAGTTYVVTYTKRLMDDMFDAMVAHMGYPLPDKDGGDEAIDIYVVHAGDSVEHDGSSHEISKGAYAVASETAVKDGVEAGKGKSALIIMPRNDVGSSFYRYALIHEFFHVLQNAHNVQVQWRLTDDEKWEEYWFTEASAEWASGYFERKVAWSLPLDSARPDRHQQQFTDGFQRNTAPIHKPAKSVEGVDVSSGGRVYQAYVWPLFMEQQSGADSIANAWRAMRPLTQGDYKAADNAVDAQLSFETNFRDFALRNLNSDFGGDQPLEVRYHQLDNLFPNEKMPVKIDLGVLPVGTESGFNLPVTSLTTEYFYFETEANVGYVEVDFSKSTPQEDLSVDAVVKKRNGKWQTMRIPTDRKFKLCDVEKAWVAVSNHNRDLTKDLARDQLFEAMPGACTCALYEQITTGWNGYFNLSWSGSASKSRGSGTTEVANARRFGSVRFEMTDASFNPDTGIIIWNAASQRGELRGDASINDVLTVSGSWGTETHTTIGTGPVDVLSFVRLEINPNICTYSVQSWVATAADDDGSQVPNFLAGLVYAVDIPLPMVPEDPNLREPHDLDLVGGGGYIINNHVYTEGAAVGISDAASTIGDVHGFNSMGIMTANWSFEPKPPTP